MTITVTVPEPDAKCEIAVRVSQSFGRLCAFAFRVSMSDGGGIPMRTDLSVHSTHDLDWVAAELNDRPRKRLGFKKPIEQDPNLLLR